jgi:hypothetical protein
MAKDIAAKLKGRAGGQMAMLTLMFLLGMAVNLIGLPDEAKGSAKTFTSIFLGLHGLIGIGLLVGSVITLVLARRAGQAYQMPAVVGLVGIFVTFIAGLLTLATKSNWWSYVMAAGFLGSFLIYGSLYMQVSRPAGK